MLVPICPCTVFSSLDTWDILQSSSKVGGVTQTGAPTYIPEAEHHANSNVLSNDDGEDDVLTQLTQHGRSPATRDIQHL